MTKQETLARKLAREWINENRHAAGHPSLRSIDPFWWCKYGPEYMEKADFELRSLLPFPSKNKPNKHK